jgi:hypothetical protein
VAVVVAAQQGAGGLVTPEDSQENLLREPQDNPTSLDKLLDKTAQTTPLVQFGILVAAVVVVVAVSAEEMQDI